MSNFFQSSLAFLWLMAFSSATHDIAADGFYMLGLTKHDQAFFVGIRNTFYRFAMLAGQGPLVILAGHMETIAESTSWAWSITFFIFAALFAAFSLWHLLILPYPTSDVKHEHQTVEEALATMSIAIGNKPRDVVRVVINIGRKRLCAASTIAAPFSTPESRN